MQLELHHSIVVADRVLREIRNLAKRTPVGASSVMAIHSYANGREQGWHLVYGDRAVSICEHRSSDDIRIWYGHWLGFSINGIPNERSSTNPLPVEDRCFALTQVKEAAAFAFYYLLTSQGA